MQLYQDLGIQFFAKPRVTKLMRLHDKLLSRKRSIIETDQLKNISQIEHSKLLFDCLMKPSILYHPQKILLGLFGQ